MGHTTATRRDDTRSGSRCDLCTGSRPRLCGNDYLLMLSLIGTTIATIVIAR
jgi:hypothetical protein